MGWDVTENYLNDLTVCEPQFILNVFWYIECFFTTFFYIAISTVWVLLKDLRWQERQESRKKTKINVFVKDLCSTTLSQEIVKLPFKTFLLKLKRSVYTNFASKFWFVCLVSWHFFYVSTVFFAIATIFYLFEYGC